MMIIGCDFHMRYQQIAMMNDATGELTERRLDHQSGEAHQFYRNLQGTVRVGIEATGCDVDSLIAAGTKTRASQTHEELNEWERDNILRARQSVQFLLRRYGESSYSTSRPPILFVNARLIASRRVDLPVSLSPTAILRSQFSESSNELNILKFLMSIFSIMVSVPAEQSPRQI
jgi:hypothetical protein